MFELDIVAVIKGKAKVHGLTDSDVESLLKELDSIADELKIEPDSLYMILLDSISGKYVGPAEQIIHQIKVAVNNSNHGRFLLYDKKGDLNDGLPDLPPSRSPPEFSHSIIDMEKRKIISKSSPPSIL